MVVYANVFPISNVVAVVTVHEHIQLLFQSNL